MVRTLAGTLSGKMRARAYKGTGGAMKSPPVAGSRRRYSDAETVVIFFSVFSTFTGFFTQPAFRRT